MLNRDEFRTSFQASIDDTICTYNIEDLMGAGGQVTKPKQKMVLNYLAQKYQAEIRSVWETTEHLKEFVGEERIN